MLVVLSLTSEIDTYESAIIIINILLSKITNKLYVFLLKNQIFIFKSLNLSSNFVYDGQAF